MGVVYRARDTRLERDVALKVLPPRLLADDRACERFEREARVIAALNHPHICTVHDVARLDGQLCLVLELLQGTTLADRLGEASARPFRMTEALTIGAQMADALDAAHTHGIIHRDLKPSNVMLTPAGVKLLDFGVASFLTVAAADTEAPTQARSPTLTAEGAIIGTVQYMAPEQVEGRQADTRADIFALGAVLYELFTGRRAFEATTDASLMSAILRDDPPSISTVNRDGHGILPLTSGDARSLDRIVQRCLAKDRDERWQSARDVAYELRWIAVDQRGTFETAKVVPPGVPSKSVWRRVATGAALVAIGLGAGGLLRPPPPESAPAAAPVLRTRLAVGFQSIMALGLSHDGRWLVLSGNSDAAVVNLATGISSPLPPWVGTFRGWSPDDRQAIFSTSGNTAFRMVDVTDGNIAAAIDLPKLPSPDTYFAWNGNDLLAGSKSTPLLRTRAKGGSSWEEVWGLDKTSGELGHAYPHVLPDGRHVLYTAIHANPSENRVYIAELGGRARTLLVTGDVSHVQFVPPNRLVFAWGADLVAQYIDLASFELLGERVRLAADVPRDGLGRARFSASDTGVLVLAETSASELRWFDRAGLSTMALAGAFVQPSLSRDESTLVFHERKDGNDDVWTYDLRRGLRARVTTNPVRDRFPVWAVDGSRVVFTREHQDGRTQLISVATDGTDERIVFDGSVAQGHMYADEVVPAGDAVVAQRLGLPGEADLFLLSLTNQAAPVPLVHTPFSEANAVVSADGRWLAYDSNRSGRREVYVEPFRRAGARVQVSTAGGITPRWRRDGRELYFVTPDSSINAVQVAPRGDAISTSAATPLFRAPMLATGGVQFDVSRDGKRFLVNTLKDDELRLVIGWPTLLDERSRNAR